MADRAGGGPLGGPQCGGSLPYWVTALTYHSGPYSRPAPLSRTTTNGCTFAAQFARILMMAANRFRVWRLRLARGPSRPANLREWGSLWGRSRGGWLAETKEERPPIGRMGAVSVEPRVR